VEECGVSIGMAIGHFVTQAATRGLIFGVIAAAVYEIRLTTIPISFNHWPSLIVLFLLADLGFYVEHRCSHRVRFLWASHSVHHSSEKMLATGSFPGFFVNRSRERFEARQPASLCPGFGKCGFSRSPRFLFFRLFPTLERRRARR
jgi:hypothetical protein